MALVVGGMAIAMFSACQRSRMTPQATSRKKSTPWENFFTATYTTDPWRNVIPI